MNNVDFFFYGVLPFMAVYLLGWCVIFIFGSK